jgi:serine/threonine protein phosphatase 1
MTMEKANKKFFIADVHGCSGLLKVLLAFIAKFAAENDFHPEVTFLGDLVDRGPDSRGCLQLAMETLASWEGSQLLLGNHDDMFLQALAARDLKGDNGQWFNNVGGKATITSYTDEAYFPLAALDIRTDHADHIEMLYNARLLIKDGPFVACHAGINGWVPLDQQHRLDLLWIREGFIDRVDATMPPVIHGHTIIGDLPVVTENRISLDTGAFRSGRLTALLLDHDERSLRFFQANGTRVSEVEAVRESRGKGTIFDRLPKLYA